MIKMLTAYTRELDDAAKAAREILDQLDMQKNLLKNSVALLFCHAEFVELGVMEAVCKSLPFATLGCTSQCFALKGVEDEILLTVGVLTSDDVEFAAGISEPLGEDAEARIDALYRETAAALTAKPSLVFSMQPIMFNLSGDIMLAILDHACGGAPVFGTTALDAYKKTSHPKTIYRGAAYQDRLALLLFSGAVKPRFFSALFPKQKTFTQKAVITEARGNRIISIDNKSALSYIRQLGIIQGGFEQSLYAIPFVIDYGNGEEEQEIVIEGIAPDESLICSKNVLAGGVLEAGTISVAFVHETASLLCRAVKEADRGAGALIFSCFSRNVVAGDPMAEIRTIQKELEGFSAPWLFLYSTGEICPQYTESGETENRLHQYSLIACLL